MSCVLLDNSILLSSRGLICSDDQAEIAVWKETFWTGLEDVWKPCLVFILFLFGVCVALESQSIRKGKKR